MPAQYQPGLPAQSPSRFHCRYEPGCQYNAGPQRRVQRTGIVLERWLKMPVGEAPTVMLGDDSLSLAK